ncbi:uncharacterized protein BO96DRAFT_396091 [Aspergillus niger CBS 101883]|uniref:Uncharacterized protein n=3 Tax=Aspergillus niger TaxID=5061 RepID=A5ABW2_ASPNC|nr:uncharacterized protein BO96DRAFT_396091 [Aspergillus niger CBS 101883]XP_059606475.1 hypothetical protein An15g03640 [Aspergillus niger]PYH55496.1 hypothetical protein BO96DRAFT_396091 [Aspergillus niger CBS 101883]RDH14967.1 hypothetical protein M747DRAFT_326405 [Aspergillus niger ATCC 13496]CAK97234.1 hypothetical protein An15g03640 [Aspergillus niger]
MERSAKRSLDCGWGLDGNRGKALTPRARTSVFVLPIHPLINFWRQGNSPKGERLFAEMLQPAFSGGNQDALDKMSHLMRCQTKRDLLDNGAQAAWPRSYEAVLEQPGSRTIMPLDAVVRVRLRGARTAQMYALASGIMMQPATYLVQKRRTRDPKQGEGQRQGLTRGDWAIMGRGVGGITAVAVCGPRPEGAKNNNRRTFASWFEKVNYLYQGLSVTREGTCDDSRGDGNATKLCQREKGGQAKERPFLSPHGRLPLMSVRPGLIRDRSGKTKWEIIKQMTEGVFMVYDKQKGYV